MPRKATKLFKFLTTLANAREVAQLAIVLTRYRASVLLLVIGVHEPV